MSATFLTPYFSGLLTMAGLIVAIGVQNAFVLRQGLKRQAAFLTAGVCFLCDASLIAIGATGLGTLIAGHDSLRLMATIGGVLFLAIYGVRSCLAARHTKGLDLTDTTPLPKIKIITTALAVSLLNPHAILDTVVLIGGLAARYPGMGKTAFAVGAMSASLLWFYGLALGARWLAPALTKPKVWQVIDLIIGAMMLAFAASLARDAWMLFDALQQAA
jgi:L-lysine exporter family protein LysE/ArgO